MKLPFGTFIRPLHRALARLGGLHRNDSGTAAVSFLLCLPIFLTIVAIIVQYALIVNAKIMVTSAAANAARAAITSLPDEVSENVKKAACFTLVPVSPQAKGQADDEGVALYDALKGAGVSASSTFADRYTFAKAATTVEYPQQRYKFTHGQDIDVTVRYRMLMTVPIWGAVFGQQDVVAGVSGKFWTVTSTVRVQTAHGRAAGADSSGWPQ